MRLESWQIATLELTNGVTVSVPPYTGSDGLTWRVETAPNGVRVCHGEVVRFYSWHIIAQFNYRSGMVDDAAS